MRSSKFFLLASLAVPFFISPLARADAYEDAFKRAYLASNYAKSIKDGMLASQVLYRNAFNKFNFTVYSELNRNKGTALGSSDLNKIGRYQNTLDTMTVGGKYRLINDPKLSSLTLDTNYTFQRSDYQTAAQVGDPPSNSARELALTVSYDLIRGGVNDPQYLSSAIEKNDLRSSLYETFKSQRDNYLSFLTSAYAVMVGNCRLRNLEMSLKSIDKSEEIFRVGSQVGTYGHKDFLNVKSLKRLVKTSQLSLDIDYQNRLQAFSYFGPASKQVLENILTDEKFCEDYLGLRAPIRNDIRSVKPIPSDFGRSLDGLSVTSQINSAKGRIRRAQVSLRPQVNPFVTYSRSREQTVNIDDRRLTLGIRVDWDVASQYGRATASSEFYRLSRLSTQYQLAVKKFENDIVNLRTRNLFIESQIENIKATIAINDELLQILSTQRSIGRIDSLSLTNAYLNRNNSLNQLYDLNSEMILNNLRYAYIFEWDAFTVPVESNPSSL